MRHLRLSTLVWLSGALFASGATAQTFSLTPESAPSGQEPTDLPAPLNDALGMEFAVVRGGSAGDPVTVTLDFSGGAAKLGVDFTASCIGSDESPILCLRNGDLLSFVSSKKNVNIEITLTPTRDRFAEGTETVQVDLTSAPGGSIILPTRFTSNITDNDTASIVVTQNATETPADAADDPTKDVVNTKTTFDGGTDTFDVSLNSQPYPCPEVGECEVTVTLTVGKPAEGDISTSELTFTGGEAGNWATPQTVTVTGKNSGAGTTQSYSIGLSAAGLDYAGKTASVPVTNLYDGADPGVISFTSATVRNTAENNAVSPALEVERSGGTTGKVCVTYSVALDGGAYDAAESGDYTGATLDEDAAAGTQLCWDGVGGTKTIPLSIAQDNLFELAESFTVNLTAFTGGATQGAITSVRVVIPTDPADNVTFSITGPASPIDEDAADAADRIATLTVTRAGGSIAEYGPVSVDYTVGVSGDTAVVTGNPNPNGLQDYDDGEDPLSGTLNFTHAGSATQTIDINVVGDNADEPAEFFRVELESSTAGVVVSGGPGVVNIAASDSSGAEFVVFNPTSYSGNEGTTVNVLVQRSGDTTGTISFTCGATPGTAGAGDFTLQEPTGVQTWLPGETDTKQCNVLLVDDDASQPAEPNESFNVTVTAAANPDPDGEGELVAPPNNAVFPSPATVTINANDNAGTISINPASYSGSEGETIYVIVTRSGAGLDRDAAVKFTVTGGVGEGDATAEDDYHVVTTGDLTWTGSDTTSRQIQINLLTDADNLEPAETFTVQIAQSDTPPDEDALPILDNTTGTVTILAAGTTPGNLTISPASYSVSEGAGQVIVYVQRVSGTDGALDVHYQTNELVDEATAGSDFTAKSGPLHWNNGETGSKPIAVTILPDGEAEDPEQFTVTIDTLVSEVPGAIIVNDTGTVTISDAPPVVGTFSIGNATVTEADTTVTLWVERLEGSDGAVTLNWTTADGVDDEYLPGYDGAVEPGDYDAGSGQVQWGSGDVTAKPIVVGINQDALDEVRETFKVLVTGTAGGQPVAIQGTVIILDEDGDTELTVGEDIYLFENTSGVVQVKRFGNLEGVAQVAYTTVDGTAIANLDYLPEAGVFSWGNGEGCWFVDNVETCNNGIREVPITALLDDLREPLETLTVELYDETGPDGTARTVEVTDRVAVVEIFNPVPVPATNSRMLALLALLLLVAGAVAVRRRGVEV